MSRTEKKALGVVAIIWVTSLVLMAPRVLLYEVFDLFHVHDIRSFCSTLEAGEVARRVDSSLMFLGTYLLPQIALAFCHLRIGLHLWRGRRPGVATSHHHDDGGGGGGGSVLGLTERRKIAKIVFAITLAFCIGWLPMHIITMYEDFSAEGDRIAFTDRAALVFGFSFGANAINPIIYCLLSRHFRMYFKCALTCRSPTDVTRTSAPAARVRIFHRHEAPQAAVSDLEDVVREERTDRDEEIIAVEDRTGSAVSSSEKHWKSPSSCATHPCTTGRQRIVLHVAPLTLTSSVSLDGSVLYCDSDMLKVHMPGKPHRKGIGQNTNDPCSSIPHIV